MSNSEKIREALSVLEADNTSHWTMDGSPRIDVVCDILGTAVSRADIVSAAPAFSRDRRNLEPPESETLALTLEAEIAEKRAILEDANKVRNEAEARVKETQRALDRLVEEKARSRPRDENQRSIRAFIESQTAQRAERARKAPIDRVRQRHIGYGHQRKARDLL